MELPELQQGLENIQQAAPGAAVMEPPVAPAAEAPWELNYENLDSAFGEDWSNDRGLGELLLQQLRMRGVDTRAATESMLNELLGGLVNDMNRMQSLLTKFIAKLAQQTQKAQAVTDAVETALMQQNPDAIATQVLPPQGTEAPVMNDIPPEMGAGDTAPNQPAAPENEQSAPETPTEPPAEAPAPETPTPTETPAEPDESAPKEKGSDVNIKNVKYTISDAGMKRIRATMAERKKRNQGNTLNNNILAACQTGF